MTVHFQEIEELLRSRNDLQIRLNLLPYDGVPEIRERSGRKYLYAQKIKEGKKTSTCAGAYTDELNQMLCRNAEEANEIRKELCRIEKELAEAGYISNELSANIQNDIAFTRANLKQIIYAHAVLEGINVSFSQAEDVLDNRRIYGLKVEDIQKILNLKHAWEFILDEDVLASCSDFYLLSQIAKRVNAGLLDGGGRIRGVPVTIGGTSYIPPLLVEADVKDKIHEIIEGTRNDQGTGEVIDTAIQLCLYCMKTQIFLDGNKRTSVIFANHYLISHGSGIFGHF